MIEHHVEDEEKEMFKIAQRLGDDELAALGEQMAAVAEEPSAELVGASGNGPGRRRHRQPTR